MENDDDVKSDEDKPAPEVPKPEEEGDIQAQPSGSSNDSGRSLLLTSFLAAQSPHPQAAPPILGTDPVFCICPYCQYDVETRLKMHSKSKNVMRYCFCCIAVQPKCCRWGADSVEHRKKLSDEPRERKKRDDEPRDRKRRDEDRDPRRGKPEDRKRPPRDERSPKDEYRRRDNEPRKLRDEDRAASLEKKKKIDDQRRPRDEDRDRSRPRDDIPKARSRDEDKRRPPRDEDPNKSKDEYRRGARDDESRRERDERRKRRRREPRDEGEERRDKSPQTSRVADSSERRSQRSPQSSRVADPERKQRSPQSSREGEPRRTAREDDNGSMRESRERRQRSPPGSRIPRDDESRRAARRERRARRAEEDRSLRSDENSGRNPRRSVPSPKSSRVGGGKDRDLDRRRHSGSLSDILSRSIGTRTSSRIGKKRPTQKVPLEGSSDTSKPGGRRSNAGDTASPHVGFPVGPEPVQITCPHCHVSNTTTLEKTPKSKAFIYCSLLAIFPLCWFGCCAIPFCIDSMNDIRHICTNCGFVVGIYYT